MRPELSSGLIGLAWVAVIGTLGLSTPSAIGRLTVYLCGALVAVILIFVAKMPSRVGRIALLVGLLVCAAATFPDAVRERELAVERRRAKTVSPQAPIPAKIDPGERNAK
jgi:hypothetical protein